MTVSEPIYQLRLIFTKYIILFTASRYFLAKFLSINSMNKFKKINGQNEILFYLKFHYKNKNLANLILFYNSGNFFISKNIDPCLQYSYSFPKGIILIIIHKCFTLSPLIIINNLFYEFSQNMGFSWILWKIL